MGEPFLQSQRSGVVGRPVARIALQHVGDRGNRLQQSARVLQAGTGLHLVRVVAKDEMFLGAADVLQLQESII